MLKRVTSKKFAGGGEKPLAAVTGAGGFIGSHVVQLFLREGWRVRALVRYNALGSIGNLAEVLAGADAGEERWLREKRLEIVHGDVLDERCVREFVRGTRVVLHLAALIGIPYSFRAPASYVHVNALGALNVLEACREEKPERAILTSTSEVYGTAQRVPIDESHALQAQSPYAASKIASDKLAESYHLSFGLPVVTLRPFNAFGPRQSARAIVTAILAQALSDDCREIRLGALDPVRDLTYVEDAAAGFLAVARAPLGRVAGRLYNMGTGRAYSVREIAERALRIAGVKKSIVSVAERRRPPASEVQRLVADATRLKKEAGWSPRVTLDEGLRRTADWIRRHPALYRPDEYRV